MTVAVDEGVVREFVTIVSEHAVRLAESAGKPGLLQLSRLNCVDDMAPLITWSREPTPRQARYLLSLFRQLGGRVK